MRNFGIGAAVVIGTIVLLVGGTLAALGWRYIIAEPAGKVAQQESIQSAPYRIAAYDRFFDLCVQVQYDEALVSSLREELTTRPPEDRVTQINASLSAIRASRVEKINQYNADASKTGTRAQFRSSQLPYRLNPNEEVTVCVA